MQACYSFFAIVRQSVVDQKRIGIPEELDQKYRDELSDIVKLSLPSGGEWGVHFNKNRKMAWFDDGLESFIEDNSIGLNYLLLFKYAKNSHFNVHIFDRTATEIDYPCYSHGAHETCKPMKRSLSDGEDCRTGDDGNDLSAFSPGDDGLDQSIFGPGMKRQRTTSPKGQTLHHSYELRTKLGKLKEKSVILDGNEHTGDLHDELDGSGDGNKVCEHNNPKREEITEGKLVLQNPHFIVRLTGYQVLGISMYVTAGFARKLLPGQPRCIYLEDENGKRWKVNCRLRSRRVSNLCQGWRLFTQDKKLVAGNVCVFELIKDSPADKPVLKVYTFPSWEHLPQIATH